MGKGNRARQKLTGPRRRSIRREWQLRVPPEQPGLKPQLTRLSLPALIVSLSIPRAPPAAAVPAVVALNLAIGLPPENEPMRRRRR